MRGDEMRMNRRYPASQRGFTLAELLIVIAMVGVMSALAVVGYRKYVNSARSSEAKSMIQGIRAAEEAYKSEMLLYLGCSTQLDSYYPGPPVADVKRAWNQPGHADYACWRQLNVQADAPVRFGYSVVAGSPGNTPPAVGVGFAKPPVWPAQMADNPWYVVHAAADLQPGGLKALFISSSMSGEIYSENDDQ